MKEGNWSSGNRKGKGVREIHRGNSGRGTGAGEMEQIKWSGVNGAEEMERRKLL